MTTKQKMKAGGDIITNRIDIIIKKTVLVTIGSVLVVIGVALFLDSKLGSDPISVWLDGLRHTFNLSIGNVSLINNVITLVIALIFARKYIFIGTFVGALLTGPLLDIVDPYVNMVFSEAPDLNTRILMILIGQIILCIGVAFNLSANFGFGTTDSIIVTICDRKKWEYKNLKMIFDLGYTVSGILLGGIFGIGSILGVVTGGPIISYSKRVIDNTVIKWLKIDEYEESLGV